MGCCCKECAGEVDFFFGGGALIGGRRRGRQRRASSVAVGKDKRGERSPLLADTCTAKAHTHTSSTTHHRHGMALRQRAVARLLSSAIAMRGGVATAAQATAAEAAPELTTAASDGRIYAACVLERLPVSRRRRVGQGFRIGGREEGQTLTPFSPAEKHPHELQPPNNRSSSPQPPAGSSSTRPGARSASSRPGTSSATRSSATRGSASSATRLRRRPREQERLARRRRRRRRRRPPSRPPPTAAATRAP